MAKTFTDFRIGALTARKSFAAGGLALLLAGTSSAAMAQTAPANSKDAEKKDEDATELVVTAPNYVPTATIGSKVPTSLLETPQSITVITRDQIELLDLNTIQEVVRYSAGASGELYGTDTRTDWIRLRGFDPALYIDGVRTALSGGDLYGFQSVDLLKGPSSSLYGLAPPGGIVNLTSRRPTDEFEGEIAGRIASFNTYELKGTVAGPASDWASGRFTALFRDSGVPSAKGEKDQRVMVAASMKFGGDRTSLTPLFFYQYDKLKNNGSGFLPIYGTLLPHALGKLPRNLNLGEPDYNYYKKSQYAVGYEFHHEFSDKLIFEQNFKYQNSDYSAAYIYGIFNVPNPVAGGTPATVPFNGTTTRVVRRNNFAASQLAKQIAVDNRLLAIFDTGPVNHTLIVGLDYRDLGLSGGSAFTSGPLLDLFAPVYGTAVAPLAFSRKQYDDKYYQTGIYFQDQIRFGDLVLTGGGRYDWVREVSRAPNPDTRRKQSNFSYRVGANYVTDIGLAPYVSYSKSFEPVFGRTYDGPSSIPGDPPFVGQPFNPRFGTQIEGGIKFQPNTGRRTKTLITFSAYRLVQSNLLATDNRPGVPAFNSLQYGEVTQKGLELEAVTRIDERLNINGSASYTDPKITAASPGSTSLGKIFPLISKYKASLFVDYTFQDGGLRGLGAGMGFRYTSKVFGTADNNPMFATPGRTLFDASIHYNIDKWRFSLNASNLFDKNYVATCSSVNSCWYGPARQISFSATQKF